MIGYLSCEGHEVVLTKRKYVNVTNNNHLIVVFRENSIIYNVCIAWQGHGTRCKCDRSRQKDNDIKCAPANRSS